MTFVQIGGRWINPAHIIEVYQHDGQVRVVTTDQQPHADRRPLSDVVQAINDALWGA